MALYCLQPECVVCCSDKQGPNSSPTQLNQPPVMSPRALIPAPGPKNGARSALWLHLLPDIQKAVNIGLNELLSPGMRRVLTLDWLFAAGHSLMKLCNCLEMLLSFGAL